MNYELSKNLKDAGFPEITRTAIELNLSRYRPLNEVAPASYPFLQELIIETPSLSFLGRYPNGKWIACTNQDDAITFGYGLGIEDDGYPTPEEAVAHLWLDLHS